MLLKSIRNYAVKAIAMFSAAVIGAGCASSYIVPCDASADSGLYDSLYDLFKERSGDPDNFMSQEELVQKVLDNCDRLKWIDYTYGTQENYLGCDGFVSLVFRLTFDTVYEFDRDLDKYWCKYDYHEEHIVASSHVDKYEIFRPGGTTVTWLYHNYVDELVDALDHRENVEGKTNEEWIEYLTAIGAQPGDILFWDDDDNDDFWAHIGIYSGIDDGIPRMWHASSVKGLVINQTMEDITTDTQYLKYVSVLPLTDIPAKAGLCVDDESNNKDFSYSFYKDQDCSDFMGRISSSCVLSEQSFLDEFAVYPNNDKSAFENKLYFTKDTSPFSIEDGDCTFSGQKVYQLVIKIDPYDGTKGTLKYAVYGVDDIRYYGGGEIKNYDYTSVDKCIPLTDFR